jgi:hypothetical protein
MLACAGPSEMKPTLPSSQSCWILNESTLTFLLSYVLLSAKLTPLLSLPVGSRIVTETQDTDLHISCLPEVFDQIMTD